MIIISEYQYFPPVALISTLIEMKYVDFELYETYQKGGFRNRCEVLGSNGVVQLVIPLVGGRTQKRLIRDVKIDYKEDWPKSHFRTLLSCYNRSAFFEFYRDGLERIFQARSTWLVDWNLTCLEWLISVLKLDIMVGKTGSFQFEYPSSEYLDFRGLLDPANRILPNVSAVPYTQVFAERAGFVPGLSILDLLFCEGPGSKKILKQMARNES